MSGAAGEEAARKSAAVDIQMQWRLRQTHRDQSQHRKELRGLSGLARAKSEAEAKEEKAAYGG